MHCHSDTDVHHQAITDLSSFTKVPMARALAKAQWVLPSNQDFTMSTRPECMHETNNVSAAQPTLPVAVTVA